MPSINHSFLNSLKDDYKKYNCFIESGTGSGDTIFQMEPYFTKLYTIEFSENYYINTKNKYNGDKISFILGDSSVVFETLIPDITDKSIFFLDGHWSGSDTGRSVKDCPLYEELAHINNLFINEAIIIVDDFRLFGTNDGVDWSEINKEKVLSILEGRVNDVYHLDSGYAKNDRLIIHIDAK